MRRVYLRPRGGFRTPLRSDTLFGLIAWGVRQVYGPDGLGRFLGSLGDDPPQPPLLVTSAFPFVEREGGPVHFFPRPLPWRHPGGALFRPGGMPYMEDRELLALVSGHGRPDPATLELFQGWGIPSRWRRGGPEYFIPGGGLFFLACGAKVHYLDAALDFLERFGFGGGGSRGAGAFDVEVQEAPFVRNAEPGEVALLLSLYHPTAAERAAIAAAARAAEVPVHYQVVRRQGVAGGRLLPLERPFKPALAMLAEGSILPCPETSTPGAAPRLAATAGEAGAFPVFHHGFGFLVPVAPGALGAAPSEPERASAMPS